MIVLTGSTPVLPEAFQKSLRAGGRLFAVVGDAPVMQAVIVNCVAQEEKGWAHIIPSVCLKPVLRPSKRGTAGEIYFLTFQAGFTHELWTAIKCTDATPVQRRTPSDTSGYLVLQ